MTVTGNVFGWYTIAGQSEHLRQPLHLGDPGQSGGSDSRHQPELVHQLRVCLSIPVVLCGWAGLGEMPGTQSWNNGSFVLRVVAHELGHNFGVHHASSLSCTSGSSRVSLSSTCSSSEYGDPFTVMGSGSSYHDHAPPSRPVRLVAIERGPGGRSRRAVPARVGPRRPGRQRPPAEHRPRQRDLVLPRHPLRPWALLRQLRQRRAGGQRRDHPDLARRAEPELVVQTQLVDTTPATATYNDAPLAVGQTLTDPVSGLRITTLSAVRARPWSASSTRSLRAPRGALTATASGATDGGPDLDGGDRQRRHRPLPGPARRRPGRDAQRNDLQRHRPRAPDDLRLRGQCRRRLGQRGPDGSGRRDDPAGRSRPDGPQRAEVAQGQAYRDHHRSCTGPRPTTTSR